MPYHLHAGKATQVAYFLETQLPHLQNGDNNITFRGVS